MKEDGVIANTLSGNPPGTDDVQKRCICGCACFGDVQYQLQLIYD